MIPSRHRPEQMIHGHALITSLVFLTLLTTLGLFTLRNTTLEIMMSANSNKSIQAFEAAEITRALTSRLIKPHMDHRGWPKSSGGNVSDEDFNVNIPSGLALVPIEGTPHPRNWYDASATVHPSFSSDDLKQADTRYEKIINQSNSVDFLLRGSAIVRVLRYDLQSGANVAMASGYEGLGHGAAQGGGNAYLYIAAKGQDPSGQATRYTATIFRYVILN